MEYLRLSFFFLSMLVGLNAQNISSQIVNGTINGTPLNDLVDAVFKPFSPNVETPKQNSTGGMPIGDLLDELFPPPNATVEKQNPTTGVPIGTPTGASSGIPIAVPTGASTGDSIGITSGAAVSTIEPSPTPEKEVKPVEEKPVDKPEEKPVEKPVPAVEGCDGECLHYTLCDEDDIISEEGDDPCPGFYDFCCAPKDKRKKPIVKN